MVEKQDALVAASPMARHLYNELLAAITAIGPFQKEVKKTSIHLVRGSAFVGVHPRKEHLLLTIKAEKPPCHTRLRRTRRDF